MRYLNLIIILVGIIYPRADGFAGDPQVKAGKWRATLSRDGQSLPFLLDFTKNPDGKTYTVYSINGNERLKLDTAFFAKDSLHIPMQLFDSEITAIVQGDQLKGKYKRFLSGKEVGSLPFQATFGTLYRFFKEDQTQKVKNISGKWATVFTNEITKDTAAAVGVFSQKGNLAEGSFLTPTGDYRFLSGNVKGDSLFLSTFDGSNAFLFKARIQADGTLKGAFWSGFKGYKTWTARPDPKAELPDPMKQTYLKPGFETVGFTFPDASGKPVSLNDPRFKGKVVIVQILGSWCPNCMDETNFLSPWYKKNNKRGVEIVGLAFERSDQFDLSAPKLKRMTTRFQIDYPILLAGTNTNEGTAKALPMLNKVMSYPTTIFIDRAGKVRKIHTGFSGPGTGKFYEDFVEEFKAFTDKLISEK